MLMKHKKTKGYIFICIILLLLFVAAKKKTMTILQS